MTITKPAPGWIYSMADYRQMFDLNDSDLDSVILDYPAGISSFNAEMNREGHKVLSGDPHYKMSNEEMAVFAKTVFDIDADHLQQNSEILRGSNALESVESVLVEWQQRRDLFLNDYDKGKAAGRYQFMDLPQLPFDDQFFDIALCSDHLFHNQVAHQDQQNAIIVELCRVAKEVRIFPLQDEKGKIASNLGQIMLDTQQKGCGLEVREVAYHEMKGGNAMLRIWSTRCIIEH